MLRSMPYVFCLLIFEVGTTGPSIVRRYCKYSWAVSSGCLICLSRIWFVKTSRLDYPCTVLVFDCFCNYELLRLEQLSLMIKQLSSPSDVLSAVEQKPHSLSSSKLPGFVRIVFTIAMINWVVLNRNRAPYPIAFFLYYS